MSALRACLIAAALARSAAGASPQACAPCHAAETAAFAGAAMTKALESRSTILRANPKLSLTLGPYSYEIANSIYSVTDGNETLRVPIEWAFGQGSAGQTYVFRRDGKWYESRVSYFSALHALDLTLGADPSPRTLAEAVGRIAPLREIRQCFACHATNVSRSLDTLVEGVQCERCHAGSHPMKKLGALTTEQQLDFCGQCHRTWSQIAANGPRGIANVRFQPYRLAGSRCYDAADPRIKCTACHNPHRGLETSPAAYDTKCAACHAAGQCKVATANCVTCHMPRLDLPGAHQKFTDHRIRIVRPNEVYPDY